MEAEDLILNYCGERKEVEQVCKVLPHICVGVLADALIVESVNLCDLARLVVSAQDSDPVWVAHFEANKEGYCFN